LMMTAVVSGEGRARRLPSVEPDPETAPRPLPFQILTDSR